MDDDDTLTVDKLRSALRELNALRLPELLVSSHYQGGPLQIGETFMLSRTDARQLHERAPIALRQILSASSAVYAFVLPGLGQVVPLEPAFPPFGPPEAAP